MEEIVIELSRYNSIDSDKNSQWTNHLSKNILIEQGDQIMVKQCFIDTRLIDNTSILIENDIEWTLLFTYYMTCHGINQYTINEGASAPTTLIPDGHSYILTTMYNPLGGTPSLPNITPFNQYPLTDKKTIYIPKGTYERSYLAEFITKQFQNVEQSSNHSMSFYKFSESFVYPKFEGTPSVGSSCVGFSDASFNVIVDKKQQVSSFQKPLATAYIGNSEGLPIPFPAFFLYYDGTGTLRPGSLSSFLIGQDVNYKYNPPVNNIGQVSPIYIFSQGYSDSAKLGKVTIAGNEYEIYDAGYIGASEVALVYNDENSGKYSFQYIHTPIQNNGNECVGNYNYESSSSTTFENKVLSFFDNYSGILFVDTYTNYTIKDSSGNFISDPFLSQLGFSYEDIVCPNARNLYKYNTSVLPNQTIVQTGTVDVDDFFAHTTKNFYPMSALSDTKGSTTTIGNYKISSNSSIFGLKGYQFVESDVTDEIYASEVPVSSLTNAGHYLIDIIGYDNMYVNDIETYSIKASVSNFYLSGDSFTSTLGPDPYIYTHSGISMSLSQLKIKIVNPVTKEAADNVGPNSTIYLQIIKAPQNNLDNKKK